MWIQRSLEDRLPHFKGKLIIISGPRQSGKSALVKRFYKPFINLQMDSAQDRLIFKKLETFLENKIIQFSSKGSKTGKPVVFIDEVHKARGWRDTVKAAYDKYGDRFQFVLSGSSAFNLRKQEKGDSLAGRAAWLSLFPISFREYFTHKHPQISLPKPWRPERPLASLIASYLPFKEEVESSWKTFNQFGSFPENLVKHDGIAYRQWLTDYTTALLDRDLKDLNGTKDVERVYQTFELLLEGTGSNYSLRGLAETIGTSADTIKSDVRALRQVLWGFDLPIAKLSKAIQIKKEKKFYPIDFCFLDYVTPLMEGAKLETQVACLLHRHFSRENPSLTNLSLGYYRDYQKRELDFLITKKKDVLVAMECKNNPKKEIETANYITNQIKPHELLMITQEAAYFEKRRNYTAIGIGILSLAIG